MLPEKFSTSDSDLESLIANPINDEISKLKYGCKFEGCNKKFKRQVHLDRHVFHHDGIKKHVCLYDDCDKSYIISTHLKRHVLTFHEKFRKPKSFKCTVADCDKYFDSVYNVERHIKNTHENAIVYSCKFCQKDFQRKLILKRHEITQHNGEYPYRCNVCKKGYIQEIHLKKHTCLQNKYKCETCNESYPKWSLLIEHSKTVHHKAYSCNCCGKEFQRKIDMQNHENSMKRKKETEAVKVSCPYEGCDRSYNFKKNLKSHIKVKHLCEKYKCPNTECGKELASKVKLNQHIKRIHEANANAAKKNEKKKRKPRKDIGLRKRSYASQLSGVIINRPIEKTIIEGKSDLIEITERESDISISEAENDDKVVGVVVALELDNQN